jgi:Fur family zinc uptake transcriptional regulator
MAQAHPDLTKNQKLVFDALDRTGAPMGAYALLDKLRRHGLRAPLQIYRALDRLVDAGLVHRLESLKAFVACAHPDSCHDTRIVAFAICDACGVVSEFADDQVQQRFTVWCRENRFQATATTMEIRGRCAQCAHEDY